MIKTSIALQDLRKRIYIKAKAEPAWRFWGLYVHVCKADTLREAYRLAKAKGGAAGLDGVTFDQIEEAGAEEYLKQIREELIEEKYVTSRNRQVSIPKGNGKTRILGIPTIRDRIVQGAMKLILEPIFEADFKDGSYGYRPKRTAHQALARVEKAIVSGKTTVIDVDLEAYFDTIRHDILLKKVARRIDDDQVMRLLKLMVKAGGKRGVPQGGVISPLLANLYLDEVDGMLETLKAETQRNGFTNLEYARYADDLVILVDGFRQWQWLVEEAQSRLDKELDKLAVRINPEKSRVVDLTQGRAFGFVGFDLRRILTWNRKWGVHSMPRMQSRTRLLTKLKDLFACHRSQPIDPLISKINPILRGWVQYFRIGHSEQCFEYIRDWVEKKVRRQMARARQQRGFGWKRRNKRFLYRKLGLYNDYETQYSERLKHFAP